MHADFRFRKPRWRGKMFECKNSAGKKNPSERAVKQHTTHKLHSLTSSSFSVEHKESAHSWETSSCASVATSGCTARSFGL